MEVDITKSMEYGIRLRAMFAKQDQSKVMARQDQKAIDAFSEFVNYWVKQQMQIAVLESKGIMKIPSFLEKDVKSKRGPKFTLSEDIIAAIRYDFEVEKMTKAEIYHLYSHLSSKSNIYSICSGEVRGTIAAKKGNYHNKGTE